MTLTQLFKLSIEGKCPLSIYWEMRRGLFRIAKRRITSKKGSQGPRPHLSMYELRKVFDKLDLSPSDSVFIHSGLGNIGVIEGGRSGVYNLLKEYIDIKKGNLLFPTFTFHPRMFDYLESNPVFDVRTAPSFMGSLTQYALKANEGIRSLHPTHSVLVIGKDAPYLATEHHLDSTPFGPNSPYQRLLNLDSFKILLLGVTTDVITYIHAVEDIMGEEFPIRTYTNKIYDITCVDRNGNDIIVSTRCHSPVLSLARDVTRFDDVFERCGVILNEECLGLSSVFLVKGDGLCEVLIQLAKSGKTVYGAVR